MVLNTEWAEPQEPNNLEDQVPRVADWRSFLPGDVGISQPHNATLFLM